jgi:hypothetical protein
MESTPNINSSRSWIDYFEPRTTAARWRGIWHWLATSDEEGRPGRFHAKE